MGPSPQRAIAEARGDEKGGPGLGRTKKSW